MGLAYMKQGLVPSPDSLDAKIRKGFLIYKAFHTGIPITGQSGSFQRLAGAHG